MRAQAEAKFRQVEGLLDAQFAAVRPGLEADGVIVRELSARHYHYKNEMLTWSFALSRDIQGSGETARVSVFLLYCEPVEGVADTLDIRIRSEVFQRAKVSHVDRQRDYAVELEEVRTGGLRAVIVDAFAQGAALLAD